MIDIGPFRRGRRRTRPRTRDDRLPPSALVGVGPRSRLVSARSHRGVPASGRTACTTKPPTSLCPVRSLPPAIAARSRMPSRPNPPSDGTPRPASCGAPVSQTHSRNAPFVSLTSIPTAAPRACLHAFVSPSWKIRYAASSHDLRSGRASSTTRGNLDLDRSDDVGWGHLSVGLRRACVDEVDVSVALLLSATSDGFHLADSRGDQALYVADERRVLLESLGLPGHGPAGAVVGGCAAGRAGAGGGPVAVRRVGRGRVDVGVAVPGRDGLAAACGHHDRCGVGAAAGA
jgi:hypothetical protein